MIHYRRTRPADRVLIKEMNEKFNLGYDGREPLLGWVAEKDEGELDGVAYAHKAAIIDPFIALEPMTGLKLFHLIEGGLNALDFTTIVVQVSAKNSKLKSDLAKLGFAEVEANYSIFKKVM